MNEAKKTSRWGDGWGECAPQTGAGAIGGCRKADTSQCRSCALPPPYCPNHISTKKLASSSSPSFFAFLRRTEAMEAMAPRDDTKLGKRARPTAGWGTEQFFLPSPREPNEKHSDVAAHKVVQVERNVVTRTLAKPCRITRVACLLRAEPQILSAKLLLAAVKFSVWTCGKVET